MPNLFYLEVELWSPLSLHSNVQYRSTFFTSLNTATTPPAYLLPFVNGFSPGSLKPHGLKTTRFSAGI
jgi:hypothetical protein